MKIIRDSVGFLLATFSIIGLLGVAGWSVYAERRAAGEFPVQQPIAEKHVPKPATADTGAVADPAAPVAAGADWKNIAQKLDQRLRRLEQAEKMSESIGRDASSSVSLIVGEYIWTDRSGRRPLKYQGLDDSGQPLKDKSGQELVAFDGAGPVVVRDFGGTGFLIDSGQVLTSGFLLNPWFADPLLDESEEPQLIPSIRLLHAYFPGHTTPWNLKIERAAESANAVICSLEGGPAPAHGLQVSSSASLETGEALVSLGYPGGVGLLAARVSDDRKKELFKFGAASSDELAGALAELGLIQPIVLQGRVNGQLDGKIFYDMFSTLGSTGGPLMNAEGKVVAMSESIMTDYPSFNLALPMSGFKPLLEQATRVAR